MLSPRLIRVNTAFPVLDSQPAAIAQVLTNGGVRNCLGRSGPEAAETPSQEKWIFASLGAPPDAKSNWLQ